MTVLVSISLFQVDVQATPFTYSEAISGDLVDGYALGFIANPRVFALGVGQNTISGRISAPDDFDGFAVNVPQGATLSKASLSFTRPSIGCCDFGPFPSSAGFGIDSGVGLAFVPSITTEVHFTTGTSPTALFPSNTPFRPGTYTIGDYVHNTLSGFVDYTFSLSLRSLEPPPPPPVLTLARLSSDVYGEKLLGADGFSPDLSVTGNSGFKATAYQNGNQIVIAVRGTDLAGLNTATYNLLSDTSFGTGTPNESFASSVTQLANLISVEHQNSPDAQITLTGHSLGGGIAQVVGKGTNLTTITFDAPGANSLVSTFKPQLSSIAAANIPTSSQSITNYRLYGDQISLISDQVGTTITVSNVIDNALVDQFLTVRPMSFLDNHNIQTLINELAIGATQSSGSPGRNIADNLVRGLVTANNLSLFPISIAQLTSVSNFLFDPGPGNSYLLQGAPGSPFFQSISLPLFGRVAAWDLSVDVGGVLFSDNIITTPDWFQFGPDVDALEFVPLDAFLKPIFNTDPFAFGLTFASTDTPFLGTLTTLSNSVPEPSSFALLALGMLVVGRKRGERRRDSAGHAP